MEYVVHTVYVGYIMEYQGSLFIPLEQLLPLTNTHLHTRMCTFTHMYSLKNWENLAYTCAQHSQCWHSWTQCVPPHCAGHVRNHGTRAFNSAEVVCFKRWHLIIGFPLKGSPNRGNVLAHYRAHYRRFHYRRFHCTSSFHLFPLHSSLKYMCTLMLWISRDDNVNQFLA